MTTEHEKKFGRNAGIHATSVVFFFLNLGLAILFGILTILFGVLKGDHPTLDTAFLVMLILLIVTASLMVIFFFLAVIFTVKTHNQAFVTTEEDKKNEPEWRHHI